MNTMNSIRRKSKIKAAKIIILVVLSLPMLAWIIDAENSYTSRKVEAQEVISKIENGLPVKYDNVTINGNIDINRIVLQPQKLERNIFELIDLSLPESGKIISSEINITNSTLNGSISFDNVIFTKRIYFNAINFSNSTTFIGADFKDHAYFGFVNFNGKANFYGAKFIKDLAILNCSFNNYAMFNYSKFYNIVSYGGTNFNYIDFSNSKFFASDGFTSFHDARFNGPLFFDNCEFQNELDFTRSVFNGTSEFIGTKFKGNVIFQEAIFNNQFALYDSEINRFFLNWDDIKANLVMSGPVYLALVKNYKDQEQFNYADDCYYSYREWRQYTESNPISKAMDSFAWASCGYGVRPVHTLFLSLFTIIIFGLLYFFGNAIQKSLFFNVPYDSVQIWSLSRRYRSLIDWIKSRLIRLIENSIELIISALKSPLSLLKRIWRAFENSIESIISALKSPVSLLRRIWRALGKIWKRSFAANLSLMDAFYYSALVFISMPPPQFQPIGPWKYVVVVEDIIGWLLLALFIVTLGNVMIR